MPHVRRIIARFADRAELHLLARRVVAHPEDEGFESIEGFDPDTKSRNPDKVRRAVEKVIKRNIDDPDLYTDYDDEDATVFFRVTPEDFADL